MIGDSFLAQGLHLKSHLSLEGGDLILLAIWCMMNHFKSNCKFLKSENCNFLE